MLRKLGRLPRERLKQLTMPFRTNLLLFFVLSSANAQIKDGCPKDQVACLDIINSSQCIEQVIIEHQQNVTRENLINCIDIPGVSSSNLPGATKVSKSRMKQDLKIQASEANEANLELSQYCLCPGCHSAAINTVIAQMFPPPCT